MFGICFKYSAEGRPFWISLGLFLHSLLSMSPKFCSWHLNEKLNNAPWADEYGVHKINTNVTSFVKCLQKGTHRAECRLSGADWHFFPNISQYSFLNDCVNNREKMKRNFTILNKNETANLSRIWLNLIWNSVFASAWKFGAR